MRLNADGTGTCRRCAQTKPAAGFYPLAYGGKGVRGVCRACTAAERREQYAIGSTTRGRDVAYTRSLAAQGLERETVEARLEEQDNRCAGCRRLPDRGRRLGVDLGGAVGGRLRGLLCRRCALVIGTVDDPAVLRALASYLEGRCDDDG